MSQTTTVQEKKETENHGVENHEVERNNTGVRYPAGCRIESHQGYGCACNPVPVKR